MNALFKYQRQPGSFKERLIVRTFKTREALYRFLNDQDHACYWFELKAGMPSKAGTYAFAGGQWHNVRKLDSSILAYI